jgi:aminoglycoside phosphotransferase (APT) family kinase protein
VVSALPGLDLSLVTEGLDAELPGTRSGPLRASLIAGGKSNLTYLLDDGLTRWALRRPPLGHVLPSAHDMGREYRVIAALEPAGFPVPRPIALCDTAEVLGAPFYLATSRARQSAMGSASSTNWCHSWSTRHGPTCRRASNPPFEEEEPVR